MIVLTTRNFSSLKDKFKKLTSEVTADSVNEALGRISTGELREEDNALTKKLLQGAKKKGVRIVESQSISDLQRSPAFVGTRSGKMVKKGLDKVYKFSNKLKPGEGDASKKIHESAFRSMTGYHETGKGSPDFLDILGTDTVLMGKKNPTENPTFTSAASTLAHELGHSDHTFNRVKGFHGKLGHISHRINDFSPVIDTVTGTVVPVASGISAGRKFDKKAGFKKNAGNFGKGLGITVLSGAAGKLPLLGTEYYASRRGMELLKEAGASKEYLKDAGSSLKEAGRSYVNAAAKSLVAPAALYAGTYGVSALAKHLRDKKAAKKAKAEEEK